LPEAVDTKLLTPHELEEYVHVRALPGVHRIFASGIAMGASWMAASAAALMFSSYAAHEYETFAEVILTPAAFLLMAWGALATISSVRNRVRAARKVRDNLLRNFRARIGYEARVASGRIPTTSATNGWDGPQTLRQMHHEWYGEHGELDWKDRTSAEMYGMDVETYIHNMKENDRD
jgi:hypothetical protein